MQLLPVYKGNIEADKEQLKDKVHIILFTGIANPTFKMVCTGTLQRYSHCIS